jgi:hypothetical protein
LLLNKEQKHMKTSATLRRSKNAGVRRNFEKTFRLKLEELERRLAPANISVTSFHYDPFIQGQDTQETNLSPFTVSSSNFGKLASMPVDGYVYAQPLYIHGVMIGGVSHDVAFVATEHDSVYAFDVVKDPMSGAVTLSQLWRHSFLNAAQQITSITNVDGLSGNHDIQPEVGITGGPVIDAASSTLYVVAKTEEIRADGGFHFVQTLHALDLATGADKYITSGNGGYIIGDTHVATFANNAPPVFANETTAIVVPGAGAENSGGANPMVAFSALRENNRPSLQLLNGRVYVAWASHGDTGPYHGWIVGFNETTLQPEKWFNTAPNAGGVGIWQSEGALSTDGTFLYFAVGNGFNQGPNPPWDPAHGNYSESVVKIDTTQPGQIMPVASYFTPFNWQQLDNADADLGSGGVMLLPDSVGSAAHPHLMVETGKDGHIYVLDRDNLGGIGNGNNNQIVQDVVAGPGGVWGNPAFYQESANSGLIFYHGSGSDTRVFRVTNGQITSVSGNFVAYRSNQTFGFPGAQPVISANGVNNPSSAVDWELQTDNYGGQGPATLHAYALPSGATGTLTELYNSNQAGSRDQLSASVKFTSAITTNGLVLVAQGGGPSGGNPASGTFNVFGTFPPPTLPPAAPQNLVAMGLSSTQIQLNWFNPPPNQGAFATAIKVYRSTADNQHFALVNTLPANATTYTDTTISDPNQIYFYHLAASNVVGDSPFSNDASAAPFVQPNLSLINAASNAVALSWTRPPVANNHYNVERSTTADFAIVTTVAMGLTTTSFTDTDPTLVSAPGNYFYRVRAFSTAGTTPFVLSNYVGVKVGPQAGVINYPMGTPIPPAPPPFDLQANGSAQFADESRLNNAPNQTGSILSNSQENILSWTTTFQIRLHEGSQPTYGNGFTFVIEANSASALGQGGSGLGYQGIANSLCIKFETTTGAAENGTGGSTGLFYAGDAPTVPNPMHPGEVNIMLDATMVNLMSQSAKMITLSYNNATHTLHEMIVDPDHVSTPFTHDYTIDLPSLLGIAVNGNTTGYVGFTGSTGDISHYELQDILNWVYTPNGPAAPHGLAVTSGAATNVLSWQTTSADDQGYYVERAASLNGPFTRIQTLGAGVTTYTDMGLTLPTQYYYRVQQFNHNGATEQDSGYSGYATGAVVSAAFPSFTPDHATLAANGNTTFTGSPGVLRLTNSGGGQASSAWYTAAVGTGAFSTTFTLKDVPASQTNAADSVLFVIQNDPGSPGDPGGLQALGHGGGAGGYGPDDNLQGYMITNSIGIKFDLYTGGTHNSSTGLFTGGQYPGTGHQNPPGSQDVPLAPIDLRTGDPMLITLTYDGGTTITETIRDTVTNGMFSHVYSLGGRTLAQIIGGNLAYAGFTAGTGGEVATQDILSWTGKFTAPLAAPPVPVRLDATAPTTTAAGASLQLTVRAVDANGATNTTYTGTVHFSSSDSHAMLPANYTFTTGTGGDNGVHTFNIILGSAGTQSLTAYDTAQNRLVNSVFVNVTPGPTSTLSVTGFPSLILLGASGNFTVTAQDSFGNVTPNYTGTVHFTSSDMAAMLPANYHFLASDNGTHNFQATFNTVGTQSITATDTVTGTITGTQAGISVQAAGTVTIDFSGGFGNHSQITANGNTTFPASPPVLRLTDGGGGEAASAYYNTPVSTGQFTTTFTFRDTGNPSADSLSFVLQNDPRALAALGNAGGGGGYGYGTVTGGNPNLRIVNSIAIKFDLWTNNTHVPTTGLFINGQSPATVDQSPPGSQDVTVTGISFASGDPIQVRLTYDGATLTEMLTDTVTHNTFSHSYTVNVAQVIGGYFAYAGFTGGTGGATAIQDIVSWTGTFFQAGIVGLGFPTTFLDHSTLTANVNPQIPPLNVFQNQPLTPNFTDFMNHSGFTANGSTSFPANPAVIRLTDGGGGEAGSAWYNTPIAVGAFTTTFTINQHSGGADGLSFVIQNDIRGTGAVGGGGGGEGYAGIFHSIAIKFDLYTDGTQLSETGLFTNGQDPSAFPGQDVSLGTVNLHSGNPIQVTLSYDGTTLTETVMELNTTHTFSHTYALNLAQTIGGPTAYVGFTGGTGGVTSIQDIVSWSGTFQSTATVLQFTDNRGGEASSVFFNTQVGVGPFSTTFTLQDTPANGADDLCFVIQADARGNTALGASGGGAGYAGITNSIAIKFDLWNHGNNAPYSTGLFTNGQDPSAFPGQDVSLSPIPLGSGDPLTVTLTYDGSMLTEMIVDTLHPNLTFTHSYALNLAQVIGANSAYVGFTAGTGGVSSTQKILNWSGQFAIPLPTGFAISAPATEPSGTPFQITVTPVDRNNQALPGYFGTVHLASSDPAAVLPANYTFRTAIDTGAHTFTVTLNTIGSQSLTVNDTTTTTIAGTRSVNVTLDYSSGFANSSNLQGNNNGASGGNNSIATFVGTSLSSSPVGAFAGHQDLGTPGNPSPAGNTTFSNGAYTLTASGSDIWDSADHFQYAYETLTGDGEIIARLVSANAPDFWTKAGLMIRTDLSAASANVFMADTPNSGHQEPVLQWRDTPGNGSGDTGNHDGMLVVPAPMWLRLVRLGNTFTGYWATDNNGVPNTWNLLRDGDPHTTTLPTTVYVGLGLTAHNNGAMATAIFDHVTVIGNTSAPLAATVARITDGGNSEAGSIFMKTKVPYSAFTTTFVIRDQVVNAGGADSLNFVLQNDSHGFAALGGGGGGGGYQGIANSIAIKFDLWTNGSHVPTTGLFRNGESPSTSDQTPAGSEDVTVTGGLQFNSGHPIQVTLTYNGTTLTETLLDTVTGQTFTQDYLVNLQQILGGTSAYIGFTGGTGGASAVMDVLSWTYQPMAVPPVASLTATSVLGANLVTNGGFETGDFGGWLLTGFGSGEANVINGAAGANTLVHGGIHAGQFGPGSLGFISQNLMTTVGASYNLDFWVSNPVGGTPTEWKVVVGGNTLIDVTNAPRFNYTHYTFTFTATTAVTSLQFGFAHPPDWFYLDDVSVTPATLTAGSPAQLTVTALDAGGHRVNYLGTVHITSTDPLIQDFGSYTFTTGDNGQHVFTGTLFTVGSQTVTVRDVANNLMTSSTTVVSPAAASTLVVSDFPSPTTAGAPGGVFVTAMDPFGNVATGYRGTVHLTSSDGQAVLEADHTFTPSDNGRYGFGVILETAGTQSITATDTNNASITGTQSGIVVNPAAASSFVLVALPTTVTAGDTISLTVTAFDPYHNIATGYSGTVHFSSSDPQANLPADSTLTNGTGTFSANLYTAGNQTITATDTVNSAVTGAAGVTVNPAAASSLLVSGYPSPVQNHEFHDFSVTALDPYGNVATSYTGTVHFTSDAHGVNLPSDYMFTAADAGVHTFEARFNQTGIFYLAATDTSNPSITGMQSGIVVLGDSATPVGGGSPSTLSALALTGAPASDSSAPEPTSATSGAAGSVTAATSSGPEISTRSLAASAGAWGVTGTRSQVMDSLFMDFESMVLDQRHLDDLALAAGT